MGLPLWVAAMGCRYGLLLSVAAEGRRAAEGCRAAEGRRGAPMRGVPSVRHPERFLCPMFQSTSLLWKKNDYAVRCGLFLSNYLYLLLQ